MLSRFFSKSGDAHDAVDYLFEKEKDAELLRGNPQGFIDVVDSLDFKNTYTSGVLRFKETLTESQKNQIMDEYTEFLTAGLNQPPEVMWVLHQEHGEDEMHFVIPNVDLESGRYFQPYAHKRDLPCRDALDNKINATHDFIDPDDPVYKNAVNSSADYLKNSKSVKDIKAKIDDYVYQSIAKSIEYGLVYTRKELVKDLEDYGLKVNQRGKGISVEVEGRKRPIRLKGEAYEQDCRFDETSPKRISEASERYRQSRSERLTENEQEYSRLLGNRIGAVKNKYSRSWEIAKEKLVADADIAIVSDVSTSTDTLLSHDSDSRESKRTLSATNADRQLQSSKQDSDRKSEERNVSDNPRGEKTRLQLQGSVQNPVIVCVFKGREIGKIIDNGNKLTAHDFKSDKAAAFNIVKNAKEKSWESITFNGSKDFVQEAMKMALSNGLKVTAKDSNQQKWLDAIKMEQRENDRTRENAFRAVADARERASGATQANEDYKGRKPDFTRQIKQLDKAYGELKMQRNDELEKFKIDINIVDYAQSLGFEVVKNESSKKSVKMKDGQQTIIISTDKDNHGIYFNVTTDKSGSIIDLVQEQKNLNLGQVRKELRPWIGRDVNARTEREHYTPKPLKSSKDEMAMSNAYAKTEPLMTHPYLTARGINSSTQQSAKFQGAFRIDSKQNAIFQHYNSNGICGFEMKNKDFTGFSSGGEKGLWTSRNFKNAEKIVIVESAIDAMSYDQLNKQDEKTAYVSIGGQPNNKQLELLNTVAKKYPDAVIISAVDNDEAGEKLHQKIAENVDSTIKREKSSNTKDWNDELNHYAKAIKQQQSRSHGQSMSM